MIVIIDYKMGNIGSIKNMLKKIGTEAVITSKPNEIRDAHKLILPGVGSFDTGMNHIRKMDILPTLHEKVMLHKTPILGICLGIQLFTEKSEEGTQTGLGWIKGETVRFRINHQETGLKIPHMGWNSISVKKKESLLKNCQKDIRFYFVHSYHVVCKNEADILATTHHGYDFVCAIQRNNILGVQFHPEKSHQYGMQVLRNFVEMETQC